jgi:hypothetical protein
MAFQVLVLVDKAVDMVTSPPESASREQTTERSSMTGSLPLHRDPSR